MKGACSQRAGWSCSQYHSECFSCTDLVSVGSYRTNISMSDFENAKEYGANDNVCMRQSQETQLGGDGTALLRTPSFGEGSKGW